MANHIAVFIDKQRLTAFFPDEAGMNIDIDEYPYRGTIIMPKGDTGQIVFSVYDENGSAVDVSSAVEVTFAVATDKATPPFINRTLTNGGITVSGNEVTVQLFAIHTYRPMYVKNYFELNIQMTSSRRRTAAAGIYRAPDTIVEPYSGP